MSKHKISDHWTEKRKSLSNRKIIYSIFHKLRALELLLIMYVLVLRKLSNVLSCYQYILQLGTMLFNEILIKMHPIWFMALIEYTERLIFSAFQKECIQLFSKYFNCKEYWEKQFWGVNVPTISMHWITMRFCVIVIFDNNPHLTFYTITNKLYTNTYTLR